MKEEQAKRIPVRIDPDLEDLIPGFLENRRKDIVQILEALEKGDHETIRVLGHSMKGCGSGYGFDEITELGRSLEQAAKNGEIESIREKTDELSTYLNSIDIVYE